MTTINDPEDPRLRAIHAERLIRRDIDQLLGICEFALQDGHIDQSEAEAVLTWLNNHVNCLDTWPANVLYDRLRATLADGSLDPEEEHDLLQLVARIARPPTEDGTFTPAALPINAPAPRVIFERHSFCFTGVFDYGSRADCHATVERLGGMVAKSITKKLNYLVIGNIGSEVWKHTSFGLKIAKAVAYRDDDGIPIHIITERHWVEHLK